MKVRNITRPDAVTADLDETVAKAAKRMRLHEVSALPVIQHDRVVGIVSERDITRAVAEDMDTAVTTVGEVMTQHPIMASPEEETETVAMRMLEHGIRHVPVVEDNRLLGVLSARDLLMLEVWPPPSVG